MRVLLCDRGSVLADFQDVVRAAYPAFQVDIETDPYRAVERAHDTRPEVIVTEIDLSGIGGIELIRRFRDAAPRAGVVVWTRERLRGRRARGARRGGAGWLLKAEGNERVLAAIAAASSGGDLALAAISRTPSRGARRKPGCTSSSSRTRSP